VPGVPSIPIAPDIAIRHRSPEHIFGCVSVSMPPMLTDYLTDYFEKFFYQRNSASIEESY